MKVVIIDNKNEKVGIDAGRIIVNGITLEEYLQIVKDAEAKLKAFEVRYQILHEDYLKQLKVQEDKFREFVKTLRDVWERTR
jgi:hypothetical protein